MSAFLGQIHYWLYKKIQLVNEREQMLVKEANERLDDLGDELYSTAVDMYGKAIPADRDLRMIIDHSNIHGWLHNQIQTSAVRECTFIKDLLDCGGEEAVDVILETFIKQGATCGASAKEKLTEDTAPAIYKIMQDYYLNGMPCDAPDKIYTDTPDHFEWQGDHSNQIEAWKKSGVNPVFMAAAYQAWFSAFINNVSDNFEFSVNLDREVPTYNILRK